MKQQKNILNEKRILDMMDHPFVLKLAGHYHDSAEVHTHAPLPTHTVPSTHPYPHRIYIAPPTRAYPAEVHTHAPLPTPYMLVAHYLPTPTTPPTNTCTCCSS